MFCIRLALSQGQYGNILTKLSYSTSKNLLVDPMLKISVNGVEIPARGKPITDSNRIDGIVRKFKSKYGEGEVK